MAAPVFRAGACVCVVSVAGPASTLAGARMREALDLVTTAAGELGRVLEATKLDTAWSGAGGQDG